MSKISQENGQNEDAIDKPSTEILYNLAKGEYDYETNRKRDLETRSGILIALIGAVIGLFISAVDISLAKKGKTLVETLFYSIIVLSYLYPLTLVLISLKNFIDVLITRDYTRIEVNGFDETTAQTPKEELYFRLANSYKNAVTENDTTNNEKVDHFKKGIKKVYKAVIVFVIVYLVNLIFKNIL